MVFPSDVAEIAAIVSEKACTVFPNYICASHIHNDKRTIEIGGSVDPIYNSVDKFWPKDCPLSKEKKRDFFWQYHRSRGCGPFAACLAKVLKDLSDSGVKLTYDGHAIVDILVMNAGEFDVSDILAAGGKGDAVLQVYDPVTGTTIPSIATYETMERLSDLGESVCNRLGMKAPVDDDKGKIKKAALKKYRPESFAGSCPHWWVAAVFETKSVITGEKEYHMIHLDICGAAYDPKALVKAPGTDALVSLQTFTTLEYDLRPSTDEGMQHKLSMTAVTSNRNNTFLRGENGQVVLQPKSIRHFRCYHKNDSSQIEATPVQTYLERNAFDDDEDARISEIVSSIHERVILKLPVGSQVTVCNIQSKPELNGRSATVCKSNDSDNIPDDRVPLLIKGQRRPKALKATCILLPTVKTRQYRSLEDRLNEYNQSLKKVEDSIPSWSPKQESDITRAMDDPDVVNAISVIHTGKLVFSSYGDPAFKRGIAKILSPSLDGFLPNELTQRIRAGYQLSNHPKADDAIKIIMLLKATKQRFMERQQRGIPDDMEQVVKAQRSAAQRIRNDEGLNFVFNKLVELGLYPVNPATLF